MPLENLEEEGLPKKPILHIAQFSFLLSLPDTRSNAQLHAELMEAVTCNNLAPYYKSLCKHLDWQVNTDLLNKMKKANNEELKRLNDELEDAENHMGERKACSLIEKGGDWDRRNRLKPSEGLYYLAIWDFKQAAELFLDTVSIFTPYELMDYKTFVAYTLYVSMIALDRPYLREKVIKGAEILEELHSLPTVQQYLFSLYECHYFVFFQSLAAVE